MITKRDRIAFISHHDLLRLFERAVRRAKLPVHWVGAYNPRPKISFYIALGVGIESIAEPVEIELEEGLPEDEILSRLGTQLPSEIRIQNIQETPLKQKVQVIQIAYSIKIEGFDLVRQQWEERLNVIHSSKKVLVLRNKQGRTEEVDILPYILNLNITSDGLYVSLKVVSQTTASPWEILRIFGWSLPQKSHHVSIIRTEVILHPSPSCTFSS